MNVTKLVNVMNTVNVANTKEDISAVSVIEPFIQKLNSSPPCFISEDSL